MTKKELYELFYEDSLRMKIDQQRKEQSLFLLNQAVDQKKIIPLASPDEILKKQLRFLDPAILLLQSLCFLLLLLLFWSLGRTENKEFLYIPMTASAPVFSMLMIAGCRREETYNIAELTGSCFFNYRSSDDLIRHGQSVLYDCFVLFSVRRHTEKRPGSRNLFSGTVSDDRMRPVCNSAYRNRKKKSLQPDCRMPFYDCRMDRRRFFP